MSNLRWDIQDITASPAIFELKNEAGEVLNTLHMDRGAKQFGAYVDRTGTVSERDFDKACEAAKKVAETGPIEFKLEFGQPRGKR